MAVPDEPTVAGADACTVFCAAPDPAVVVSTLASHLEVAGVAPDWPRVVATGPTGRVVVSRTMFTGPGGAFSSIILGTHNAVRQSVEVRSGARSWVLGLVEGCDMVLGVRFDPAAGAEDVRAAAVRAVAAATGGVILVARGVLDPEDQVLVTL